MINTRWIRPARVLLLILSVITGVFAVKAYITDSQGPRRATVVQAISPCLSVSRSLYIPSMEEGATDGSYSRRDLLLQVEQGSQEKRRGASIWLILLGIFLGGLTLNLTPCVYPLIPITISYFGGKSEKIRGRTIVHGIVYLFGLAMTNSLLGLSAALSGGMLGFALQKPSVLIFVAAVMLFVALSFFGLWEIRLPAWLTRVASKGYGGFFGTFFMGLTLGIVAAPCLGPFILGLLLWVGRMGDPLLGFLFFFVLSIGLGLPLSVLAIFSGAIARLPRSGDWMLWVRRLMGWILIGMAAYMVSPVVSHLIGRHWLLLGVSVAACIHLGWLDRTGSNLRIFPYLKKAVGVAMVCGGIIYLLVAMQQPSGIRWIPYDQSAISRAAKEGKPVMIDFYAEWCAPCVVMEKEVFTDPEVIRLSRDVIAVRVDLTRKKPFHEGLLEKYRVRGIPTVVFLNGEGVEEEGLRIKYLVTKSEVLDRLRQLGGGSPSSSE
jgi:thiol:disulfide interchange protein DsbD